MVPSYQASGHRACLWSGGLGRFIIAHLCCAFKGEYQCRHIRMGPRASGMQISTTQIGRAKRSTRRSGALPARRMPRNGRKTSCGLLRGAATWLSATLWSCISRTWKTGSKRTPCRPSGALSRPRSCRTSPACASTR